MSAVMPPRRSLLRRSFAAFALLITLVWAALLVREVLDVRFIHARNGQAWNHVWAKHVRMQTRLWAGQPEQLQAVLTELETLRRQEWEEMSFEPPVVLMQVWEHGRLVHEFRPPVWPKRLTPPDLQLHAPSDAWLFIEARDEANGIRVLRWQERPGTWHFSIQGLSYYARPLLYSLPLMLLPAWLLTRMSFAPLKRMGRRIARRDAKDLSPLPPSPYVELSPVVNGVNRLMARLQQRLSREREFLVDAAHELKTPLAVIKLNAETLTSDTTSDAARLQARQCLKVGLDRATHTVHQLLALARSGADRLDMAVHTHDLVDLARGRLVLACELAIPRHIELALSAPDDCFMPMNRETLGSLIDNLVDNAVKYSPEGSLVEVLIERQPGAVRLTVRDAGPGIPEALRAQVLERFYRVPGHDQPGSGLGLSIVDSAAAQHGAELRLEDGPQGVGLSATVVFPVAD